jgi:hypothetical protein
LNVFHRRIIPIETDGTYYIRFRREALHFRS